MSTTTNATHCESCGSTNPEDLRGDEGYTACCNELACDGYGTSRFGTPTDFVSACCWGRAERLFDAAGRDIPEGAHRLNDR